MYSPSFILRAMPAPFSLGAPASLAIWAMLLLFTHKTLPSFSDRISTFLSPTFISSGLILGFPPCASIISLSFFSAFSVLNKSLTFCFPFSIPTVSKSTPAMFVAFSLRSAGPLPMIVIKASLASNAGPIVRPIGCSPKVTAHWTFIPKRFPKSMKSYASEFACPIVFIFAPLPAGISMTKWEAPIAFFLLIIDGRRSGSIARGYSIWMKMSSAGAKSNAPPQTIQPFVLSTTSRISSTVKSTGHNVSTLSAVPAGEVTALEEVFGMINPAAAMIGATKIVVLSPGTPPILCLSRICLLSNFRILPVSTIALAKDSASSMLIPCIFKAVTNDAISMSLKWRSTTSLTTVIISFSRSLSPRIFACT